MKTLTYTSFLFLFCLTSFYAFGSGDNGIVIIRYVLPEETSVTLDASGNLTITDINGGNSDDELTLSINGNNLRITDPNNTLTGSGTGVTAVNSNTIDVPLANITGNIVVDTKTGTDTLNLDANLNLTGTQGIEVRGATTINQNAVITYVNGAIDYQASDNITFNNGAALMGSGTGTGEVLLLSEGNIVINGAIQNAAEMNGGAINLVAGWDSTTTFNATTFDAFDTQAELAAITPFGRNSGSVTIGNGNQASGVAVGSRSGATRVYGHNLNILAGTGANGRYAQLGFQVSDQGTGYNITGVLSARVRNDITATGGAGNFYNYAQLGHLGADQSFDTTTVEAAVNAAINIAAGNNLSFAAGGGSRAYSQLGHGGAFAIGNHSGTITLTTTNDIGFTGGDGERAIAQLGHGGESADGTHSGTITISKANDLTFNGGTGLSAHSQLGHGGRSAMGDHSGDIKILAANDLRFTGGDEIGAYSLLGHGGLNARGNHSGAITISTANDLNFFADDIQAYSQLGHGGAFAEGNHNGAITITTAHDLNFSGGGGSQEAYSQLGHGGSGADGDHSGTISIITVNDLNFTSGSGSIAYSQLGHGGIFADGIYSGDITLTTANSLSFSGGNNSRAYSQLGHGSADFGTSVQTTGTRQGHISVTASGEISLVDGTTPAINFNYGWIGHGSRTANAYSNADVTISAAAIDSATATVTAGGTGMVRGDFINSNLRGGNVLVQVTKASLTTTGGNVDFDSATAGVQSLSIDTANNLILMASHHLLLNHSIQNAAETNGGAINLIAGWDGTTAFDATTFDAFDTDAELSGATPFGNNSGSVSIGDGTQTSGVAVGSRSGATRVYGHDLNITAGTGANGRYAQLGFQASDKGASYTITGALSTRVRNNIVATGGAGYQYNYAQLGHVGANQVSDPTIEAAVDATINIAAGNNLTFIGGGIEAYSQLGHGGTFADGNHSGTITITTVNDLSFTGGGLRAYSQLGHGGYLTDGDYSGAITINTANDLSFSGGNTNAYSQFGHGGRGTEGNYSGAITITTANDLSFSAGSGYIAYSQLGHGGADSDGDRSGAITITTVNDLSFSGGGGTGAYSQFGHGGILADGDHSGDITLTSANNLSFTGSNGGSAYSQLGHGAADFGSVGQTIGTRQGAISVTATGEISLVDGATPATNFNYGWIGHGSRDTAAGTYTNADVTISAARLDNAAAALASGGQGTLASNWLLNNLKGGAVSLSVTDAGVGLNAATFILGTVSSTHQLVVDVANDLVFNNGFAFTHGGAGNLIFAAGEDFHNDSGSTTPLTTGGRWLVYSTNPDNNRQDLEITNYNFTRYNTIFNPAMPILTGLPAGHGLLYVYGPEIEVSSSESGALTDGGSDAQGDEASSISKTVTYTITNSGTVTLTLTGTASVTNLLNISSTPTVTAYGTSSLSALASTSLSASGSTTFEITYIPDCGSNFSFDVSIANDDTDENPFNFTVSGTAGDTTAPVTPTLGTSTAQCSITVTTPTTMDNCSGVISGTTSDSTTFSSQGTHTILWTFTDAAGNSSTATQTVVIQDTIAPVVPVLPELFSEDLLTLTPPTTNDNCSGSIVATTSNPLIYYDSGSYVVTWTFTDGVGNRSIAFQKIRIERSGGGGGSIPTPEEDPCETDVLAPVAPVLLAVNDVCQIELDVPTAEDNCSGTVTGVTTASLIYEQVGSYIVTWTFTDTAGNSSTAVQLITILYDQEVIDTQEACASFTWIDGVVYTESNNTATFETTDAQGCTSLHRLDLTINPLPDTTVTLDNNILSAVHTGAQYQWIDCENGNTPIAGATQQSFAPTGVKGSYTVQITTAEGCTLTSDCIPYFDTTTLLVAEGISPNGDGVNDTWVIQGIEFHPNAQIYVYNRSGEVVFSTLNGYNNDWRGDWNETGRTLPSAPYFYTLDRDADGKIDDYGWIYIQN